MKRTAAHVALISLWLGFIVLVAGLPVLAQGQNLLINPGFEPPFQTLQGKPAPVVANGWLPWHIGGGQSESENIQPDYYPASDINNSLQPVTTPRIRNGSDAQQFFTWFATFDGGVYQRVTNVTPGADLTFSAYAYVWSSTQENANMSEEPGGVVVQVGIDPTGGTDGSSANIVWSEPSIQYDAYNQYSVTTTTNNTAVTVFVRATVTSPIQNNLVYVDDASLVAEGQAQPPSATFTTVPTNTPVPTVTPVPTNPPVPTNTVTSIPTVTPVSTEIIAPTATNTEVVVVPASPSPTLDVFPATATVTTPSPTSTTGGTIGGTPISNLYPYTVIHVVQPGDTVGKLATLYASSIQAIVSANGLNQNAFIQVGQALVIPVQSPPPAPSTPTATTVVLPLPSQVPTLSPVVNTVYVVQSGDTLLRIALRFKTTVAALAQLNGIANPNMIRAGQRLLIPAGVITMPPTQVPPPVAGRPTTYVVQPGDTLFRIALRFSLPVSRLIQANGIIDPNRVFIGQVLAIP